MELRINRFRINRSRPVNPLLRCRIGCHVTWFGNLFVKFDQYSGADPGFGQGGAPASEAESCRRSEAELRKRSKHSAAGVQGP